MLRQSAAKNKTVKTTIKIVQRDGSLRERARKMMRMSNANNVLKCLNSVKTRTKKKVGKKNNQNLFQKNSVRQKKKED